MPIATRRADPVTDPPPKGGGIHAASSMTTEIDITPAHLRCSIGGCPTVIYTPAHLRCGGGASSCPGVTGNGGVLTIVGKQVEHPKAGPGEAAVEIGEEYFSDYVKMKIKEGKSPDGDRAVVNEAPDGSSPFGLPSLLQAERERIARVVEHCGQCITVEYIDPLPENNTVEAWKEYAKTMIGITADIIRYPLRERDRNPKGGDLLVSVEDESPVPEGNSPSNLSQGKETT